MSTENREKPNIVLLMTDQWRGDCMGIAGHPVVDTPNLDNLFQGGTRFERAWSAVPSCIAARAALLTGMSQKNHGRPGYCDRVNWQYENTLPKSLADAGYHTHCVGKMHVFPARNLLGFHSIDLHDGYLHNERCRNSDYRFTDDYIKWLRANCDSDADITDAGVGCNGYSVTPWPYEEKYHATNWVTSRATDFLDRRDPTKPFFLKVSYHRPHPPFDPPKHYLDRYLERDLPELPVGDWAENLKPAYRGLDSPVPRDKKQIDLARCGYYAHLTHIDCQINRIIHALAEHNVLNNTLIMFISDHGEMLYDHNCVAKSLPYPGSASIPFMIRFPGSWGEKSVSTVSEIVELRDVMPTLLDAAGVDIPDSVDGKSLLPLCRGEGKKIRDYIHGEHPCGSASNQWINTGSELYVWYSQTGEEQYFNLDEDPETIHNAVSENMDRVCELRNILISELEGREEGYVENGKLVTGRKPKNVLDKVCQGVI